MTSREEELLAMAEETRNRVTDIHDEVDIHKRYDAKDSTDSYGKVIEWLHVTGQKILSE